jgi:hypothetical protein
VKYLFLLNQQKNEKGRLVGFDGYEPGHALELVYKGTLPPGKDLDACENLFRKFNIERPFGYGSRSMSVGDVVVLQNDTEQPRAYACASLGFRQVDVPDQHLLQIVMEGIQPCK